MICLGCKKEIINKNRCHYHCDCGLHFYKKPNTLKLYSIYFVGEKYALYYYNNFSNEFYLWEDRTFLCKIKVNNVKINISFFKKILKTMTKSQILL